MEVHPVYQFYHIAVMQTEVPYQKRSSGQVAAGAPVEGPPTWEGGQESQGHLEAYEAQVLLSFLIYFYC